jgi:hypothetical protein
MLHALRCASTLYRALLTAYTPFNYQWPMPTTWCLLFSCVLVLGGSWELNKQVMTGNTCWLRTGSCQSFYYVLSKQWTLVKTKVNRMGDDGDDPAHPSLFSIQAGTTKTSQRERQSGFHLRLGHVHCGWRSSKTLCLFAAFGRKLKVKYIATLTTPCLYVRPQATALGSFRVLLWNITQGLLLKSVDKRQLCLISHDNNKGQYTYLRAVTTVKHLNQCFPISRTPSEVQREIVK